jgi:hypothetical protein
VDIQDNQKMKRSVVILLLLILFSCGKHSTDNPNPGGSGGNNPPAPAQVTLSAPSQNSTCNSGVSVSDTQSSVTFSWDASANTDSYELDIRNLLDNTLTTQATSQTQSAVTLLKGTPYSWYVVSKSSKTTATTQSDIWKFYNSGPGMTLYAPFPADLLSPAFGQQLPSSTTVNLTWYGDSVYRGPLTYDVYFGTSTAFSSAYKSGVTTAFLNNVPVQSGTTYYWKVITNDNNGNSSDSGVSQFSVQ